MSVKKVHFFDMLSKNKQSFFSAKEQNRKSKIFLSVFHYGNIHTLNMPLC